MESFPDRPMPILLAIQLPQIDFGWFSQGGSTRYDLLQCSSLERKISTSTGQSESYASASLVKDVVWTRHLAADHVAGDLRRMLRNWTLIIKESISN